MANRSNKKLPPLVRVAPRNPHVAVTLQLAAKGFHATMADRKKDQARKACRDKSSPAMRGY